MFDKPRLMDCVPVMAHCLLKNYKGLRRDSGLPCMVAFAVVVEDMGAHFGKIDEEPSSCCFVAVVVASSSVAAAALPFERLLVAR